MIKYRISEKALADIQSIWFYTMRNWSKEQADRYYRLVIEEIEYLCSHFDSGKSMDHIKKGYRASKVKSHLIFYRKSGDELLEVIRILHQSMDIENRLND